MLSEHLLKKQSFEMKCCTRMFVAALLKIAKKLDIATFSSKEWKNWSSHTMEY